MSACASSVPGLVVGHGNVVVGRGRHRSPDQGTHLPSDGGPLSTWSHWWDPPDLTCVPAGGRFSSHRMEPGGEQRETHLPHPRPKGDTQKTLLRVDMRSVTPGVPWMSSPLCDFPSDLTLLGPPLFVCDSSLGRLEGTRCTPSDTPPSLHGTLGLSSTTSVVVHFSVCYAPTVRATRVRVGYGVTTGTPCRP